MCLRIFCLPFSPKAESRSMRLLRDDGGRAWQAFLFGEHVEKSLEGL